MAREDLNERARIQRTKLREKYICTGSLAKKLKRPASASTVAESVTSTSTATRDPEKARRDATPPPNSPPPLVANKDERSSSSTYNTPPLLPPLSAPASALKTPDPPRSAAIQPTPPDSGIRSRLKTAEVGAKYASGKSVTEKFLRAELPTDDHHIKVEAEEGIPQSLQRRVQILKEYIRLKHWDDIQSSIENSHQEKEMAGASVNRFVIRLELDIPSLLDFDLESGTDLLTANDLLTEDFTFACVELIQDIMGETLYVLYEQVLLTLRIKMESCDSIWAPLVRDFKQLRLYDVSQPEKRLITIRGVVESIGIPQNLIYSRTHRCMHNHCRNQNYLHLIPSARSHRVIKRSEESQYIGTSTSAILHNLDLLCSHCGVMMNEMVGDRTVTARQLILLKTAYEEHTSQQSLYNTCLIVAESMIFFSDNTKFVVNLSVQKSL
ncbi:hypothetical protein BKA69DRAFT_9158 [Paraphysoderma sedebokerense]|nr:hypothetical protein BKA69DRAFT_9158 [Paraphysoderma sedebokerense]